MVTTFLRKCGCGLFLWWVGGISLLPAQGISPCEIDLSILKTAVVTDFSRANPGKVYYLDAAYLQSQHFGDIFGPVAAYYEYLRPATRRELRQDTIKATTIARVLNDGNIYKKVAVEQKTGFFEVTKYFQGDFSPLQREPELLLPKGLIPFDIEPYREAPFALRERTDAYAVFECQGRQVVVYAAATQLADMFHSEEAEKLLKKKETYARSLLGLEVRLSYDHDAGQRFLDLELADCRVTHDYVIFSYWSGDAGYLYIDGATRFHFLEKACALTHIQAAAETSPAISASADKLLNEIVRQRNPAKMMQENPVLMEVLMRQFELAEDNYAGITWYLHKDMTPAQTSKTSFLRANLNSNGILYLQSNYFSTKGLNHSMVAVSAGTENARTATIPAGESRNLRIKTEDGVEEQVHFTKGDDGQVIPFIARHAESPLTLTFINDAGEEDRMPIPEAQKRAIRDTYVLYLLIGKQ